MSPDDSESEAGRAAELIEGSAELAGASIGAAIGLVGGPPGAFGGAAAGVAATRALRHVGSEVQQRWLGPRQRLRVGAAYTIAAGEIAKRLNEGDSLRSDGFFSEESDRRPAAEELLEGVMLVAADAYEEGKVPFLGQLYASLAFDDSVPPAHANFLIGVARALKFRQMALMAVVWEGDAAPLIASAASEEPPRRLSFGEELGLEADELERLAIIGRGEPGGTYKRGGATFVDASSLSIGDLTLTGIGKRLHGLMGLSGIATEPRQEVLSDLMRVGPS